MSNFILYLLLMALTYIVWGGFFSGEDIWHQLVFNFAVFYPVGLWAGFKPQPGGRRALFIAAVVFNLGTYFLAYSLGMSFDLILTAVDFSSMAIILFLALYVGRRARSNRKKE